MSRWSLWLVDPVCGVRYDSVCFGLNSLWCIQECPLADFRMTVTAITLDELLLKVMLFCPLRTWRSSIFYKIN